jgi:predicted DNA-binding transcriptional regulator AlpA
MVGVALLAYRGETFQKENSPQYVTVSTGISRRFIMSENAQRERMLTSEQTSEYLGGVSLSTLQRWRKERIGPRWLKLGRSIRYRSTDLEAWIAANARPAAQGRLFSSTSLKRWGPGARHAPGPN